MRKEAIGDYQLAIRRKRTQPRRLCHPTADQKKGSVGRPDLAAKNVRDAVWESYPSSEAEKTTASFGERMGHPEVGD